MPTSSICGVLRRHRGPCRSLRYRARLATLCTSIPLPDVIPVGQGMMNVQLLVVDRENRNRICNIGEQGELYLRAAVSLNR